MYYVCAEDWFQDEEHGSRFKMRRMDILHGAGYAREEQQGLVVDLSSRGLFGGGHVRTS